ncbi:MAG: hypothetical protein LBS81_03105 [Endomicrobium sp.]|jgi:adenosylmethionine-8-amino-7-oxononanoate aminotransferase|nr:hypothetical protein [Endomicrobium sp.]
MFPYCYRCNYRKNGIEFHLNAKNFKEHNIQLGCSGECIKEVETVLAKIIKKLLLTIIEPLNQDASGMIVMPPGYLKEYSDIC